MSKVSELDPSEFYDIDFKEWLQSEDAAHVIRAMNKSYSTVADLSLITTLLNSAFVAGMRKESES